jgi:hypothetical protein
MGPAGASSLGACCYVCPCFSFWTLRPFKDLEALLCNCLYTICGLCGQGRSWQDRACAASAVMRRDMAVLPMAAENDLAHLRLLREVVRRIDNADDALLRDPLVAAVYSSCQALTPSSWLAQCSAERNTFPDTPAQPSNRVLRSRIRDRVGQRAADLSGSTIAPGVTTRCGRSSRCRRVGRHRNPLDAILRAPAAQPMAYLHAPSHHTALVLMLRSLHLPGEYADPAPGLDLPDCRFCHMTVRRDDEGQVSEAELRWRHVCHYICGCPAIPTAVQACHDFSTAMSALALRSDMQLDVPLSVIDVDSVHTRSFVHVSCLVSQANLIPSLTCAAAGMLGVENCILWASDEGQKTVFIFETVRPWALSKHDNIHAGTLTGRETLTPPSRCQGVRPPRRSMGINCAPAKWWKGNRDCSHLAQ